MKWLYLWMWDGMWPPTTPAQQLHFLSKPGDKEEVLANSRSAKKVSAHMCELSQIRSQVALTRISAAYPNHLRLAWRKSWGLRKSLAPKRTGKLHSVNSALDHSVSRGGTEDM